MRTTRLRTRFTSAPFNSLDMGSAACSTALMSTKPRNCPTCGVEASAMRSTSGSGEAPVSMASCPAGHIWDVALQDRANALIDEVVSEDERIGALENKLDTFVKNRREQIAEMRNDIAAYERELSMLNNAWDAEEPWKMTAVFEREEIELLSQYKGYGMYGDPVRQ